MLPKNRIPSHPGETLKEEFLKPMGLTQSVLAAKMKVPIQRVNELVNGKRGITPETAILLSKALGTSEELWMSLQSAFDLVKAKKRLIHS